jgi:CheY-like chemotaxis protein
LIILDIEMPELNGLEVYERLKGMPSHFLILTAHSHPCLKNKAWNQNVGILMKPFCKADMSSLLTAMAL